MARHARSTGPAIAIACFAAALAQAQPAFETPPVLLASSRLPASLLAGPLHQVLDEVANDGLMNRYRISTPNGTFLALSDAELVKRVQEVAAIARLKQIDSSSQFNQGIADAGGRVVDGTKALVSDPVNTLGGIVQGAGALLRRAGDSVFGAPGSRYEDSAALAVTGVSQKKRELASQAGIDPYSSNDVLQAVLTHAAQAGAAGNLVASGALAVVGGGAGTFLSVTGGSQTLNEVLRSTPPSDLRRINREKLARMGVGADLADLFIANAQYSPTYQVLLVDALERLRQVDGRDAVVRIAASADSDALCMLRQRGARMVAGYHEQIRPLERLQRSGNLLLARARDGRVVVALPVDHVIWTASMADSLADLEEQLKSLPAAPSREFWVGGSISDRARAELEARGWNVYEQVADRLIGPG